MVDHVEPLARALTQGAFPRLQELEITEHDYREPYLESVAVALEERAACCSTIRGLKLDLYSQDFVHLPRLARALVRLPVLEEATLAGKDEEFSPDSIPLWRVVGGRGAMQELLDTLSWAGVHDAEVVLDVLLGVYGVV
jgi:hypothetical protein